MRDPTADWSFVSVDLELTNRCGNGCAVCPRQALSRPSGAMGSETFLEIAGMLGQRGSLVSFSGMGDPLLHPEVFRFCRDVRHRGADVCIVVHPASLAGDGSIERLVRARPNSVVVSFPSSRKQVFERLCPNVVFEQALAAMRSLIRFARGTLGVRVSGIRTRLNSDESPEFVRFWEAEGVRADMIPCHGRGGHLAPSELYVPSGRGLASARCSLFSYHSFITWEGNVLACCHDLSGETRLGNLVEMGVDEVARRKAKILRVGTSFALCSRCDEPLRNLGAATGPPPADRTARRRFFQSLKRKTAP